MSKKKKPAKKAAKAVKKVKINLDLEFDNWWAKNGEKRLNKIVKDWKKHNIPNDDDDEGGGDYWHINNAMWNGDFFDAIPETSFEVFKKGFSKEEWQMDQSETTYDENLDRIIIDAYEAGKQISQK